MIHYFDFQSLANFLTRFSATSIVTAMILLREGKSIDENWEQAFGISYIKSLPRDFLGYLNLNQMTLILQRTHEVGDTTFGKLYLNDMTFLNYTLEDKVREIKIKHQTTIPAGTYEIIINKSERFKQMMPLLLNVPGFDGIRIHKGNSAIDTSGCILVGILYQTTDY